MVTEARSLSVGLVQANLIFPLKDVAVNALGAEGGIVSTVA